SMIEKPGFRRAVALAGVTLLVSAAAGASMASAGNRDDRFPRAQANMTRVNALIHAMTLDEKISLLTGSPGAGTADPQSVGQAGFVPGVPRLGFPASRFTDG